MVVTSSYGRTNTSNVYIYKDTAQFKTTKTFSSYTKKFSFANMVEACYIGPSNTYFLFESGAETYRNSANTRPLDRYVAFSNFVLGFSIS